MDSAMPKDSHGDTDVKPSYHKAAVQETVARKYRRHSPIAGSDSSASGGSPKHQSRSPVYSSRGRKKEDRDMGRDSSNDRSIRGADSHRHSDKNLHGTSHDHPKNGDYSRHHRHPDEEDKGYHRSSRSGRESRSGPNSEYARHNYISDRPREAWRSGDKYSRDKYESSAHRSKEKDYRKSDRGSDKAREIRDEKRDRRLSPDDYKNVHVSSHEEARAHGKDTTAGRESGSTKSKDAFNKENDVVKDKRKHDDKGSDKSKEKTSREAKTGGKSSVADEQNAALKKLKHYDSEDENPSSSSKLVKGAANEFSSGPVSSIANQSETVQDLNAAKVAAMKAAELVNKNLVGGTSYLSTDQKKKLLWGNKKNTSTDEKQSSGRWDLPLFADRERQEKFNKLMGVKGDVVAEGKLNEMDTEQKQKLEMDLEKQYTAGLRRRDGRTVGLGL